MNFNKWMKIAAVVIGIAIAFFGYRWFAWQQYYAKVESHALAGKSEEMQSNAQKSNVYEPIDDRYKDYPLHNVVYHNDLKRTIELVKGGVDVNQLHQKSGNTPLHIAMLSENPLSFVKLLLENGANPYIANNRGNYPVEGAISLSGLPYDKLSEKEKN